MPLRNKPAWKSSSPLRSGISLSLTAGSGQALSVAERLIVLDELGFIPFSAVGAQLIFQFVSALYERVAIIVTTNLKFADWTQIFGDERLTLALLDRLTHRAHIIEFLGESYRFRQRMQRQQQEQPPRSNA